MRIFQEEIFGPVLSVTTFKDDEEALEIANDTLYGLGAGVWTRDINTAYRFGRGIQADVYGQTAIISTLHMQHLVDIKNLESEEKTIK